MKIVVGLTPKACDMVNAYHELSARAPGTAACCLWFMELCSHFSDDDWNTLLPFIQNTLLKLRDEKPKI